MNAKAEQLPRLVVTCSEAAKILRVSQTTFWRLAATGKLKKLSRHTVALSELERFCKEETI